MNKYLITRASKEPGKTLITSRNSRELKRKIKSTKPKFKRFTDGVYDYVNKDGKICFSIEYRVVIASDGKATRVVGKEVSA